MKIAERGVLNCGESDGPRAVSTFPSITTLLDGSIIASYRVGSSKDSDDGTIEFRRSTDCGRSWSAPVSPFGTSFGGRRGSLWLAYATPLSKGHLLLAALWVDRETHSGCPLFNEETEGCLPMRVLLTDSHDGGDSWSEWRELLIPSDIGPPSLTNPILRLPCGRLIASIETNKDYYDRSPWRQRVVHCCSDDNGQTWSQPHTVAEDKSGRIFNWDQRAAVSVDGSLVSFTWTYDRVAGRYLNIHRRLSTDRGQTWSDPEDIGFADQASHPAILPDGRLVLAWVDRFQSGSIRARVADRAEGNFDPTSEVVLYDHASRQKQAKDRESSNTGALLAEMGVWNYGLPYAETLPDGDVLVAHYEPSYEGAQISWTRLEN